MEKALQPIQSTQFWAGPRGRSVWPKEPLGSCPSCSASTVGRPYCPNDGTLTAAGSFSVGQKYLVEARLGQGGMALVFAARHQVLGKAVALKILRRSSSPDPTQ